MTCFGPQTFPLLTVSRGSPEPKIYFFNCQSKYTIDRQWCPKEGPLGKREGGYRALRVLSKALSPGKSCQTPVTPLPRGHCPSDLSLGHHWRSIVYTGILMYRTVRMLKKIFRVPACTCAKPFFQNCPHGEIRQLHVIKYEKPSAWTRIHLWSFAWDSGSMLCSSRMVNTKLWILLLIYICIWGHSITTWTRRWAWGSLESPREGSHDNG